MRFLFLYNEHSKSCWISDYETLQQFARFMTTKEKYPVVVVRVKPKKSI
jgi:hypothetical protein